MKIVEHGYKELWENIEELKPFPFSPYYKLIPLKQLLAGLDKNAMKAWKAIEGSEIKLEKFLHAVLDYEESISAKRFCSDFDDNETLRKKIEDQKPKRKKYDEKIKRYSELIEERNELETIIETGMPSTPVNEAKRRIDNINREIESIECYLRNKKNKPIAYVYDSRQRNRAIDIPSNMIKAIREMTEAIEQFQESIQSTNEKLAYLFKHFNKIRSDYDLLQLYFSTRLHKTSLYVPAPRFVELSDLRYELNKLAPELPTLFATEINQIKDADKYMIIGIFNLIKVKTSAAKIAMKVYEWANRKKCPSSPDDIWSKARHILENYTYPKKWRRKTTRKLILNEYNEEFIKILRFNLIQCHEEYILSCTIRFSSPPPKYPVHPVFNRAVSYALPSYY